MDSHSGQDLSGFSLGYDSLHQEMSCTVLGVITSEKQQELTLPGPGELKGFQVFPGDPDPVSTVVYKVNLLKVLSTQIDLQKSVKKQDNWAGEMAQEM